MARTSGGRMVFTGIRGRDGGSTSPQNIPAWLAAECLNIELDGTTFGQKRLGHTAPSYVNSFPGGATPEMALVHIPGADASQVEIFGLNDTTNTIARLPQSTGTWGSALTLSDNPAGNITKAVGVSFNSKFVLAYDTTADRMHVAENDGTTVRRMGVAAPSAAPTVANTGAGAYAATQRWYQQSFRIKSGTTVLAEGERSSSVPFTPSGTGTAAQITKASTPAGESPTHWVIWASADSTSGPFYELTEVAIGSSTYDDSAAPSTYSSGTAAQETGTFTNVPSAKFVLNDGGNRLLFAGAFESGQPTSRVWFTPTLGSLGRGDDERYLNTSTLKYYVDLDENDGGAITGFGGPLHGQPIVFKERQVWRLVPTGDVDAPYAPRVISKAVGCVSHRTVKMGVDEVGAPALYFLSQDGPYRLGANGLQYLGFDIEDLWSLRRSSGAVFAEWYPKRQQYWVSFSDDTITPPPLPDGTQLRVRFHARLGRADNAGVVRGGWVKDAGIPPASGGSIAITGAITFLMVPYPYGLTGASLDAPRPHVLTAEELLRGDATAQDDATNFRAYVETPPQFPGGLGRRVTVGTPLLVAKVDTGAPTLTVTQLKNYSDETRAATVAISTTRSHKLCEAGGGLNDCDAVAFRAGDGSAQNSGQWTIDALVIPWEPKDEAATL